MSQIDERFSCPFCKQIFSDVIKFIPDCGNNMCGRCYENLKKDVDEQTKQYECLGCKQRHTLPQKEFQDNKDLMAALSIINSTEKPLHPNAKKLRDLVRKIENDMEKLRTFDEKELIQSYCEQIELEASEAIEQAIKHLQEIEKRMMRQISEYREKCLASLFDKSLDPENRVKQELQEVTKEITEFNERWNKYFGRIEAFESEDDIKTALDKTEEYMSSLESIEERMRKEALNWETMVFQVNLKFLKKWNHVGEIKIIAESKPQNQRDETAESLNPLNSTTPKKMTIQETPSFTLTGHSNTVRQVLFLPDGRLASCSCDGTIKIWNVENGKEIFQLKGHTHWVYSIAFLPNGHLASGSYDKTIKIWDLKQRKIRSIKAHSNSVVSLRVLKNGNLVSYSNDDTIKIWNLNSKENEPVSTLRGHGNTIWDAQLIGVLSNDDLVTCSRPSRNDKEECILRVWNPNESNSIKSVTTGYNDARSLLVLSNDQVALGFDESGTIKIIDLNDKALSRTKERAHYTKVYSLAQLSNGNLVSAGWEDSNNTIKMWNLIDWRLLQRINNSYRILSLSVSSDERFLASCSVENTIKMWPISHE